MPDVRLGRPTPVCVKRGASFCRFRSVNSQARTGVYFLLIKSAVHCAGR